MTSVEDAVAAERGGADRLEVVSAMERDGLTPAVDPVARLREAVALPLRVMLRPHAEFGIEPDGLEALCRAAERMREGGATEFVLGFLRDDGRLDWGAMREVVMAARPSGWTLHRAFDRVTDARVGFGECAEVGGPDLILSAGSPNGLGEGLRTLAARVAWQTERVRLVAGGGLREEYIAPLRAAGITEFHAGRGVRAGGSWEAPVDEVLVRRLVTAVRGQAHY